MLRECRDHTKEIRDIAFSKDMTMFITSSFDKTAMLWDFETMEVKKIYKIERAVNAAAISPLKNHIMLGGGGEAVNVALTSGRLLKNEVNFFHMIHEELIGTVKGHFGPINCLAFHPSGKGFASGSEDGYVRIHQLDEDYFDLE